jgi:hypothetical protein
MIMDVRPSSLVGGGPCGGVEGLEVLPVRVQVAGGRDGRMSRLLAKFFFFYSMARRI